MSFKPRAFRFSIIGIVTLAACVDSPGPVAPTMDDAANVAIGQSQGRAAVFENASPIVMALAGTVFADHDETTDRLVFGVEHASAARGVATVLTRLGVSESSYDIIVTEPVRQVATLRDVVSRPVVAGVQIHFGQYVCSIGFNADSDGQRSMFTASHCTNQQGGVEGTQYYQPLSSINSTVIATEVEDPEYFRGGECPRGKRCRYSDAARAVYNSSVASDKQIARTSGPNNNSLTITGFFDVTDQGDVGVGTVVNKIGRTTGWTQGSVSRTCVHTNVSGSNIHQRCQTFVTAGVNSGDSGSDVFQLVGGSAKLVGILWGGSGSQFVYSPISGIVQDLGPFDATK